MMPFTEVLLLKSSLLFWGAMLSKQLVTEVFTKSFKNGVSPSFPSAYCHLVKLSGKAIKPPPPFPCPPKAIIWRRISLQAAVVPGKSVCSRWGTDSKTLVLDDPISESFTDSTKKILDQREVYPVALRDFCSCDNPCGSPWNGQNYGPFPLAGEESLMWGCSGEGELPK